MKIGIDKIDFFTPNQFVDMVDLANVRGDDPDKYTIGIGQEKMAVPLVHEDAVTMGAAAADKILDESDKKDIGLLIVATESGVDESKAAALYIKGLLDLPDSMRSFEMKEACYSATAALQMAKGYILQNPEKTALIISSDIARYGLETPGEVTQGAGSVAMLVKKDPSLLAINDGEVYHSEDVGDFWRPTFSKVAYARGKYSNEVYMNFYNTLLDEYKDKFLNSYDNINTLLFHIPYTKMGSKALKSSQEKFSDSKFDDLMKQYQNSILYSKQVGNLYSGSLYLGLISYLENDEVSAGDVIHLFSYGSGSVGEMYSMTVQEGFKDKINKEEHVKYLNNRRQLTVPEYEREFKKEVPVEKNYDLSTGVTDEKFYLAEIKEFERIYKRA